MVRERSGDWMRGEGAKGSPACDGDQVIGWHRQSRDHRISVQPGTQRHCGEDLSGNPPAQGRSQVAHGIF